MGTKKLLQINPVVRINTSTGRIMQEIGELVMQHGWESYIAYSKGRDGIQSCQSQLMPVGNRWSVMEHGVATRLLDCHGLSSGRATRHFVRQVELLQPDVIHIHNIHGYFLNYRILFDYLLRCNIPVVWTIHDCWLYTGHCYHYSFAGCNKWTSGCGDCPQRREFPASWWRDRSRQNYLDKQAAFASLPLDRLTLVPVSEWMRQEMQHSFLRKYPFRVIHNGINTDVFHPSDGAEVKRKYGIEGQKLLLGVASVWSREKGLDDLLRLAERLNEDEVMMLVGVGPEVRKRLPRNVIGVGRTENIQQLAQLYAVAEAFVNPTWQDNYPTVNLEAIACGTPVVTYRTGGSIESVTPQTGLVVEQGDVAGLLEAVRCIEARGKEHYRIPCRHHALQHFKKEDRYADYLRLYDELLAKKR